MQEEVTDKAVAIIIDGAKISEHTLEKALKASAPLPRTGRKKLQDPFASGSSATRSVPMN